MILNSVFVIFINKDDESYDLLGMTTSNFEKISESPWTHYSLIYVGSILSAFGCLVVSLSVLSVITVWIESMRDAHFPRHSMLNKFLLLVRTFKFLYMILGAIEPISIALETFSPRLSYWPLRLIRDVYSLCCLVTLAVTIWVLLDFKKPMSDLIRMKREQLCRIGFLALFQASIICSYEPLYGRILFAAIWIAGCLHLIWPKTLVDLETSPVNAYYIGKIPSKV